MNRIYFELGNLLPLHRIDYEINDAVYVPTNVSGYETFLKDLKQASKNNCTIYTNDILVLYDYSYWSPVNLNFELFLRNKDNNGKWESCGKIDDALITKLRLCACCEILKIKVN